MTRMMYFLALFMIFPAAALAADGSSASPPDQIWALVAGALVPLATYVINKWAPWTKEPVKVMVMLIVSAIAGGLTQAITEGNVGFNRTTLGFVLAALIGSIGAHNGLWRPGQISIALGGGQNAAPKAPKVPAA